MFAEREEDTTRSPGEEARTSSQGRPAAPGKAAPQAPSEPATSLPTAPEQAAPAGDAAAGQSPGRQRPDRLSLVIHGVTGKVAPVTPHPDATRMDRSDLVAESPKADRTLSPSRMLLNRDPHRLPGDDRGHNGHSATPAHEDAPAAAAPARGRARKLLILGLIAALLLGVGGWYGYRWWTVGRFLVSTDDAYVRRRTTRRWPPRSPAMSPQSWSTTTHRSTPAT